MIVLGLDPGSRKTGWGLIREVSGVLALLDAGVIRTEKEKDFAVRLGLIHAGVAGIIGRFGPDEAAVENVFVSKNAASALKLGQARGAALAACAVAGLPVSAYEPNLVKQSLTGAGRAEKSQVAFMVGRVLSCREVLAEDAADALAVAVCHLGRRRLAKLTGMAG